MLPTPAMLTQMRVDAQQFFHEPIDIITHSPAYDEYGQQIPYSGGFGATTVSGYFGGIRGDDRELVKTIANVASSAAGSSDGFLTNHTAIVLLPHNVTIVAGNALFARGKLWRVVWTNQSTMDTIKVYTKAIVVEKDVLDKYV